MQVWCWLFIIFWQTFLYCLFGICAVKFKGLTTKYYTTYRSEILICRPWHKRKWHAYDKNSLGLFYLSDFANLSSKGCNQTNYPSFSRKHGQEWRCVPLAALWLANWGACFLSFNKNCFVRYLKTQWQHTNLWITSFIVTESAICIWLLINSVKL